MTDRFSTGPQFTTHLGPVVLMAALLGCAPHPPAPSAGGRGSSAMPPCVVGDASAQTRDTLYVVGADVRDPGDGPADCAVRGAAARPPAIISEAISPGTDMRDVLDRGPADTRSPRPDVVVTRDPNVLAYAASVGDYITIVLPYARTYALVAADTGTRAPSQAERDALARDAVSADTRGAAPPFAWLTDRACAAAIAPAPVPAKPAVAYPANDVIAQQLAERIVALAGTRTPPEWLPAGLASRAAARQVVAIAADSIAGALSSGRAAAAVVAMPRDARARCGTPGASLAWHGIPLVDSRAHAIVRRGSGAAFIVGADGALQFVRRPTP